MVLLKKGDLLRVVHPTVSRVYLKTPFTMFYGMHTVRPELVLFKKRLMMIVCASQFRFAAKNHNELGIKNKVEMRAEAHIKTYRQVFGSFELVFYISTKSGQILDTRFDRHILQNENGSVNCMSTD